MEPIPAQLVEHRDDLMFSWTAVTSSEDIIRWEAGVRAGGDELGMAVGGKDRGDDGGMAAWLAPIRPTPRNPIRMDGLSGCM